MADLSSGKIFLALADQRRQAAIAALGGSNRRISQAGDEAFAELVAIAAADRIEEMRFTAIFAAFGLLHHCKTHASQWVPRLVAAVRARQAKWLAPRCCKVFGAKAELFQAADVKAALALVRGPISSRPCAVCLTARFHISSAAPIMIWRSTA